MFTGKISVSQRHLNTTLYFLDSLFQLHRAQLIHFSFGFLLGGSLASLGADRLEHLCYQLYLGVKRYGEYIAVKVYGTALVPGFEILLPRPPAYQGTCRKPSV